MEFEFVIYFTIYVIYVATCTLRHWSYTASRIILCFFFFAIFHFTFHLICFPILSLFAFYYLWFHLVFPSHVCFEYISDVSVPLSLSFYFLSLSLSFVSLFSRTLSFSFYLTTSFYSRIVIIFLHHQIVYFVLWYFFCIMSWKGWNFLLFLMLLLLCFVCCLPLLLTKLKK